MAQLLILWSKEKYIAVERVKPDQVELEQLISFLIHLPCNKAHGDIKRTQGYNKKQND